MATTNKNTMLPTWQGNYKDMIGALRAGDIKDPCFFWLEDRNDLCLIHWEKQDDGTKTLVPHVLMWEKFKELDEKVTENSKQLEGLKDPETGEPVKVTEYVTQTVTPVVQNVTQVTNEVNDIKKNGAAILFTSDGGDD